MAGISEFIVSVVELVDAQASDIRRSFLKSANSVLLNIITGIICIIGLVFFCTRFLKKLSGKFGRILLALLQLFYALLSYIRCFRAKRNDKRKAKTSGVYA